jgi:lysozyme
MKIGKNGLSLLKNWEQGPNGGFASISYKCSGNKNTIGWGHVIKESDKIVQPIDRVKAEELLLNDIEWAEDAINKLVKVEINQNQFDSLVCFVFNIGENNFRNSTLLKLLNEGSLDLVPTQLMRWVYAAGKQLRGLENRRFAEVELWNKEDTINV